MFQVKRMRAADFSFAIRLANTMNWNMTKNDFEFISTLEPDGCFVLFDGVGQVGIATCISYGSVGWFGNLVVKEEYRRSGGGSALLKHAVNYLHDKGVTSVGLYAYPELKNFYDNYGFKCAEDFVVLNVKKANIRAERNLPEIDASNLRSITEFDSFCFGWDRRRLLEAIIGEDNFGYSVSEQGKVAGYVVAKVCGDMAEVGPLVCRSNRLDIAEKLLRSVLDRLSGLSVNVCLPKKATSLIADLSQLGFREDFYVTRMFLGKPVSQNCIYIAESLERG
jgi:ribosomal protein S18 acetylase RimI-like enzyme